MRGVKVIGGKTRAGKSGGLTPMTYYEATKFKMLARTKAPFSFVHQDPINGIENRITMIDYADFIPAELFYITEEKANAQGM